MSGATSRQTRVWWSILLSLFVCSVVGLGTSIHSTSKAQNNSTPTLTEHGVITLIAGEYFIDIVRIWKTNEADGSEPDNDTYLILELTIHNASSSDTCFYRGDFNLLLEDDEIDPSDMDHIRDQHYEDWDYPGPFNGQCVDEGESTPSFVSFDVDLPLSEFRLRFKPDEEAIVLIWLEPLSDGEFSFGILTSEQGEAVLSTHTPTPSITSTRTPSATPSVTLTGFPSNTPRSTTSVPTSTASSEPDINVLPASGTRYINASAGTVNVRSEPSTNARIVGTLSHRDPITITGQSTDGNWYRIEFNNDDAWVFASLTSSTRPPTSGGGGSGGSTNPTMPSSPVAAVCDCSGDTLNCGNFNTQSSAQACFNYCTSQGRGDIHRLDGDNDSIACESLP